MSTQIEEKPKVETPFEWIDGEANVKALVERFYDLMDLEPDYTNLRAGHAGLLYNARQRLFWFLCGWLGGPQCQVALTPGFFRRRNGCVTGVSSSQPGS